MRQKDLAAGFAAPVAILALYYLLLLRPDLVEIRRLEGILEGQGKGGTSTASAAPQAIADERPVQIKLVPADNAAYQGFATETTTRRMYAAMKAIEKSMVLLAGKVEKKFETESRKAGISFVSLREAIKAGEGRLEIECVGPVRQLWYFLYCIERAVLPEAERLQSITLGVAGDHAPPRISLFELYASTEQGGKSADLFRMRLHIGGLRPATIDCLEDAASRSWAPDAKLPDQRWPEAFRPAQGYCKPKIITDLAITGGSISEQYLRVRGARVDSGQEITVTVGGETLKLILMAVQKFDDENGKPGLRAIFRDETEQEYHAMMMF